MSYHVTQFYQAFSHALVLQATSAGARRPGYEATSLVVTDNNRGGLPPAPTSKMHYVSEFEKRAHFVQRPDFCF